MAPLSSSVLTVLFLIIFAPLSSAGVSQTQKSLTDLNLQGPIKGPVKLEAGMMVSTDSGEHLFLSGRVRVIAGDLQIESDWLELWPKENRAVFGGGVKITRNRMVLLGDRLELDRDDSRALLHAGLLLVKKRPVLAGDRCKTSTGLIREGVNQLYLRGNNWVLEDGKYRLEQARFSLCHCRPGESPSWELRASSADVIPDERAWLLAPVLALKGLGVFALPVAYIPLSPRRSGLLMPQVSYSGRDGFMGSESLFVTLGEHADSTFSLDWIQDRGLRQRLELRAIPVRSSWFVLRMSHIYDRKADEQFALPHRYAGELNGFVDFSSHVALRTSLSLFSDSSINRDFMSDMAGRAADYASSVVSVSWSGWSQHVSIDASWRQDLRIAGVDLFGSGDSEQLKRWGMDPVGDTIQRLGAINWTMLAVQLFEGTSFDVQVELANLSSIKAAWRDWGMDGTPNQREPHYEGAPSGALDDRALDDAPGGLEGNGSFDSGELRRAVRLRAQPRLKWSHIFAPFAKMTASLSHRQLVYLPHGPDAPTSSTRGISFASFTVDSELYRVWGSGDRALGHLLRPKLALAGAWQGLRSHKQLPYLDIQDRLMQDATQLLVGMESVVFSSLKSSRVRPVFRLCLDQAVDLREKKIAQLLARMEFDIFPLAFGVRSGWSWEEMDVVEVDASMRLHDRRGDHLGVSYLYLPSFSQASGLALPISERTQREPGLLFGLAPEAYRGMGDGVHVIGINAGLNIVAGLSISGSVLANLFESTLDTYGAGLTYKSDCGCWGISASFRMLRGQDYPDVFFLLDLGALGSAGASTASRF